MTLSPSASTLLPRFGWSPDEQTLTAFRDVCWYSWPEQTRSMERLLGYRFEWVLPATDASITQVPTRCTRISSVA